MKLSEIAEYIVDNYSDCCMAYNNEVIKRQLDLELRCVKKKCLATIVECADLTIIWA